MLNQILKKIRLLPYRPLDYGQLNGNCYTNDLINWELHIPEGYKAGLADEEKRRQLYELQTGGRLMNSKKEINESIRWTPLVTFGKDDDIFSSRIRKQDMFEKVNFKKQYLNRVDRMQKDRYTDLDFEHQLFKKSIGGQAFEGLQISEILNYGKPFGNSSLHFNGLRKGIIIQFNISYSTKEGKDEILNILHDHSTFK